MLAALSVVRARSSRAASMDDWPIKFHPHLDLASTYDDNVLISSTTNIADFSFTVSPGLQLVYGNADHNYLSLDYTAGIERFYRRQNSTPSITTSRLTVIFTSVGSNCRVDHAFKDDTTENFEAASRLEEQQNLTSVSAEYSMNQYFSVGALYHQEFHHFPTPGQIDNELFEPGVAVYYHVSPKTDFLGNLIMDGLMWRKAMISNLKT